MSYINCRRIKDSILVWERTKHGRSIVTYPGIFEFYSVNKAGKYQSLFGDLLVKHEFDSYYAMEKAKEPFTFKNELLYESDIGADLKLLAREYFGVDAPKLHYCMLDIEVDYDPRRGFSSVDDPYAPINAVALYKHWLQQSIVIAVPPKGWDKNNKLYELSVETDTEIILVDNEKQLLDLFLTHIEDADCLSGWNSEMFDMPYIAKRIEIALSRQDLQRLCFPEAAAPSYDTLIKFGNEYPILKINGRFHWDYMELFKKFEMDGRPSYSLEAISNEILPELPKLHYDGTLASLYNNDFEHFIRYNIRDTHVLRGFEQKLGYLALANDFYHSACGLPQHVGGTLRLADLSFVNFCHYNLDRKVPDWDQYKVDGTIHGAMVLTPQVGLHELLASVDVESLYPSMIRCVNISAETLIGQMDGVYTNDDRKKHSAWEAVYNDSNELITVTYSKTAKGYSGVETHTAAEWKPILLERKWAISGSGTLFDQSKQGMIPAVLTDWFAQRKKYKKLMSEAKNKYEQLSELHPESNRTLEIQNEIDHMYEQYQFYNRRQYVYKIKLNSAYGALSNYRFRFFDLALGQSTTGSGRALLEHMCSEIARNLDGQYSMFSSSIAYGDTDSCYFKTNAEHLLQDGYSKSEVEDMAIKIADNVGKKVNASFNDFCRKAFLIQPDFENIVKCSREAVAKRGIFVAKKRYVLKLIDLDGYRTDKLKAMGLEMKKTTTPKHIQKFLADVVNMILNGDHEWLEIEDFIIDFRTKTMNSDQILEWGLPKGVQKVESYYEQYKINNKTRLPGHVSATIFFNLCIKEYNDVENMPIVSGTKIKVFYLNEKIGRFKSIALPTDLVEIPQWFHDNYTIDKDKHQIRLIDNNLEKIFTAIGREVPTLQSQFSNELLMW